MKRPRVVVTRPANGPDRLTERLQELGCEVVAAPAIRIGPPRSYEALDRLVRSASRYGYLLFMSRNAVRYYVQRARRLRRGGPLVPADVQVGVVGTATGALAERAGMDVTVRSEGRTGVDLAEAVAAEAAAGAQVAVIQAEDGLKEPAERLRTAGMAVTRIAAYRTRPAAVPRGVVSAIRSGEIEALAFASPSSAVSFAVALGGLASVPASVVVAAIGPTTAAACVRAGRAPDVVAAESSGKALGEAVVGYLEDRSSELRVR